ncbi:MAG TPA: DUF432 domain-containing protein [Candidatus Nitrosotenuis sp.]|nr:DUF432 domain-containing protein [Candidatus Nitrosotenuis sp.]
MTTKISHCDNPSNNKNFSSFGRHQLQREIILNLPNNAITIEDLGSGRFTYVRNSQNTKIKKIIQVSQKTSHIELVPVLPIHVPSYKTDFFFLRFQDPAIITENSTFETQIAFPIEIGLFLVDQGKVSGFDFFSCESMGPYFGLYGTPENGRLCKYAISSLEENHLDLQQFLHAQFKIKITNELDKPTSVGKIVFPITDHDLYYNCNNVVMDGLYATIKNRVGLHVIETVQNPMKNNANWSLASRDTEKTDYKFSMDRGFD